MKKTRVSNVFLVALAVLLSCRLASPEAKAAGKEKHLNPKSMKDVLEKAEAKMGKSFVSMGYGAYGQQPPPSREEDKTLAPFFYVAGGDPETDRLPLKRTSADVRIAGVIAKVRIDQSFENSGKKAIEAIYVFPASTRAAVHAMRMRIGERTVEAKIDERDEARQKYEAAKTEGKRASLLEQQRPNVFTMNVANIMPGDRIDVEMDYSELLVPEEATYEFVYPTVVGPRYGGGADPLKDSWISNPYLKEGEKEPYKFDIKVALETGIPLKEVLSPSHKVAINYTSKSGAEVRLDQDGGGNKDFILRYRLADDKIETGVLQFRGEDENFFVVMMEPPERPNSSQIPPREYIFVLDVSGSMYGFPLDTAKSLMQKLLGALRQEDYLNLVLFAGASYKMSERSLPATQANVKKVIDIVNEQKGGGGTELMDGLRKAYSIPKAESEGVSRTVVVVTDGYVGVEAQAFKFIRENLDDANLFAFGIGSSVNRALIEGMARAGMGEPFVVLKPETADGEAERFRRYVDSPVLTDISVEFKGFRARDILPEKVPDLMARRPIVLMGKYEGEASGELRVSGIGGEGRFTRTMDIAKAASGERTEPIRWLWARKWVEILEDEMNMLPGDEELKEAITSVGLNYSILTSFTSFVAIDSEVVNKGGKVESIKQPLPLPEGVSNYAVGGIGLAQGGFAYGSGAGVAASAPKMEAKEHFRRKGSSDVVDSLLPALQMADPEIEPEERDDKAPCSVTMTFSTKPAGSKLKLLKRKNIEWIIKNVLLKKASAGKIPSGSTIHLVVTVKIASDGKVASLSVSGDKGYGIADAIRSRIESLSGFDGLDSIEISVVCSVS